MDEILRAEDPAQVGHCLPCDQTQKSALLHYEAYTSALSSKAPAAPRFHLHRLR